MTTTLHELVAADTTMRTVIMALEMIANRSAWAPADLPRVPSELLDIGPSALAEQIADARAGKPHDTERVTAWGAWASAASRTHQDNLGRLQAVLWHARQLARVVRDHPEDQALRTALEGFAGLIGGPWCILELPATRPEIQMAVRDWSRKNQPPRKWLEPRVAR